MYINWVKIGLVVLEIQKAEFGGFTILINNTVVCHAFLFSQLLTHDCVLICGYS